LLTRRREQCTTIHLHMNAWTSSRSHFSISI